MTTLNEESLNPVLAIFQSGQKYFGVTQLPGDQATFQFCYIFRFNLNLDLGASSQCIRLPFIFVSGVLIKKNQADTIPIF